MISAAKKKLIFLHIPKAGGSTLRALLHKQYEASATYKIESDINGDILRFQSMPAAERKRIKLITGHMAFGLHSSLPGAAYITLLRKPESKVLSEFRFIKQNPYHVLHESVSKMSLSDYLDCGLSSQINNGQTRLIAGVCKEGLNAVPGNRELTKGDFEQALINLRDHFIHPGTLEYYDETILLWAQYFGWNKPFYLRENVTAGQFKAPTSAEREKIAKLNQWDIKLYQSVTDAIETALSNQTAVFDKKLNLFKRANWLYGKTQAAKRLAMAKLGRH